MKKTMLISCLLLAAAACYSQEKKDTVKVPVYIVEKIDTVQVPMLAYAADYNLVKWSAPGYYIRKGMIQKNEKGEWQYLAAPTVIGALDDKKRPVKPI
jgi:hypothetical protein